MRNVIITSIILLHIFIGCDSESKETTTSGNLHVYIPESIAPMILDQINSFLGLYGQRGANISYSIVTSSQAAIHFIYDSARIAILTSQLSQKEKEIIKNTYGNIDEIIIGYDAIAVIANPKNTIDNITTTEIQKVLNGKIVSWDKIKSKKTFKGKINLYYQQNSDVADYLVKRFALQTEMTKNILNVGSEIEIVKFVESNYNGIGFISSSWLDSLKANVKVLNVARSYEDTDTLYSTPSDTYGKYVSPHPANLLRNYYPLKRTIYIYTRGGEIDLAAGFTAYVASAEGQKLILNRGVLPGAQSLKLKLNAPED